VADPVDQHVILDKYGFNIGDRSVTFDALQEALKHESTPIRLDWQQVKYVAYLYIFFYEFVICVIQSLICYLFCLFFRDCYLFCLFQSSIPLIFVLFLIARSKNSKLQRQATRGVAWPYRAMFWELYCKKVLESHLVESVFISSLFRSLISCLKMIPTKPHSKLRKTVCSKCILTMIFPGMTLSFPSDVTCSNI
jgi:hypothetical protein